LSLPWRKTSVSPIDDSCATLAARGALAGVIRRVRPRWLFAPYWIDAHPDHVAATRLVEAARFWAKLTKCDLPGDPWHPERIFDTGGVHLKLVRQPAFVVDISSTWPIKQRALAVHASQFPADAPQPTVLERVEAAAVWWGSVVDAPPRRADLLREPVAIRGFGDST